MDFHYADWFPKNPNVGYETLIYDVMICDPTLFMRADMAELTWRIVQPALDAWAAEKVTSLTTSSRASSFLGTSHSPKLPYNQKPHGFVSQRRGCSKSAAPVHL
jgi:hypothetical protein